MGKVEGELKRLLEQDEWDVICMQEVMASTDATLHLSRLCFSLSRIIDASKMPYHTFAPNYSSKVGDGHFELGNVILSKIPILDTSSTFTHGQYTEDLILGETPKNNLNIMSAKLANGLTIVNHHGYWCNQPMGDEHTVEAFKKAADFVRKIDGPLVMCGDLNVEHDAPAMREFDFLRDLTHENNIDNTLSGLKFNGKVACDHILVNDSIDVKGFRVIKSLASDHYPVEATIEF